MSTVVTYSIGKYRANERSIVVRGGATKNGAPLIIATHGRGGDATAFGPVYWNGLWPITEALAEAGYIVMSIDAGASLSNWGNQDAMDSMGSALNWAVDTATVGIERPRASYPIGLMGWSMGGLTALNASYRYAAGAVAGLFLFSPALDLDVMHANATYTTEINNAYGGTYDQGDVAFNPQENHAAFAGGPPIRILHSTDDPTTPYSMSETFAAGVAEAELLTRTGRGHFPFVNEPPSTVVDFFKGVLPL